MSRMVRSALARARGFTLVELMIVVAIIGILAAIAIPAFSRYSKKSRTPEAMADLNKLWAGALAYYESDHMDSNQTLVQKQFPRLVPTLPSSGAYYHTFGPGLHCGCRQGQKCAGGPPEYGPEMFYALNFVLPDPHSYNVLFQSASFGTASAFTAQALGDLDCDNTLAVFMRRGSIDPTSQAVTGNAAPVVVFELE